MNSYDTLIISGGSVNGISMLGKIDKMISNGELDLKNIKNFGGTSIGAVISFLLMIDYSPKEIFDHLLSSTMWKKLQIIDFLKIFNGQGVYSSEIFKSELNNLILKKFDIIPKFKDFEKNYFCCSVNLNENKILYFEKNSFPDLDIIDALLMSCSIPFLIEPFIFEGSIHIDGGILDNFPVKKSIELFGSKKILGIKSFQESPSEIQKKWSMSDFFSLFFCSSIYFANLQIEEIRKDNSIDLNLINIKSKYPFYKFNLKNEDLIKLFNDQE